MYYKFILIDVIQIMMYNGSHFKKGCHSLITGQISRDPKAKNLFDDLS